MAEATIITKPMSDSSRTAAWLSFVAAAAFVALLAALHALKPELDPSWRFISEYELGDYGWMMQLAFFSLALSCASLGIAIRSQVRTIAGYFGLALLLLSAVGMTMGGVFVTDSITATGDLRTSQGKLHELGAMLDAVPFAALLVSWSLSRNQAWIPARRILRWTAGLPLIGLVIFIVSMVAMLPNNDGNLGPTVLIGWPNRLMILSQCAWLMPVAWRAIKMPRSTAGIP
jgi:hypothetical protein